MAELKTKVNDGDVDVFLDSIEDQRKRGDCFRLSKIFYEVTGELPKMWGDSIVGFGTYHYKYASGREGDWFLAGFSPRKQNLTLYVMAGFGRSKDLMGTLGKYKTGKSCLYINSLDDIDVEVLKELIRSSVAFLRKEQA